MSVAGFGWLKDKDSHAVWEQIPGGYGAAHDNQDFSDFDLHTSAKVAAVAGDMAAAVADGVVASPYHSITAQKYNVSCEDGGAFSFNSNSPCC